MHIRRVEADEVAQFRMHLVELLQDAVEHGASIGFLPPVTSDQAHGYWDEVATALRSPYRILLVAEQAGTAIGTVQLDLAARPNGSHRAEVAKLMVHSDHRRQGIGEQLMRAIELEARNAGRTTLILDTRKGDPSERLYLKLGYLRAGTIPEYARSFDGSLHTTVFMYKLLG